MIEEASSPHFNHTDMGGAPPEMKVKKKEARRVANRERDKFSFSY